MMNVARSTFFSEILYSSMPHPCRCHHHPTSLRSRLRPSRGAYSRLLIEKWNTGVAIDPHTAWTQNKTKGKLENDKLAREESMRTSRCREAS